MTATRCAPKFIDNLIINDLEKRLSGGTPDIEDNFPSALRLVSNELILGSAVLIEAGWALSAAHCVKNAPDELYVQSPRELSKVKVDTVYWRDEGGTYHSVQSEQPWPETEQPSHAHDRLILLKLSKKFATLRATASLSSVKLEIGAHLTVAGYGEYDGVYDDVVRISDMRLFCKCSDNTDQYSMVPNFSGSKPGMPRSDDSGAPVFLPMPGNRQRLVGIHVSRGPASGCCTEEENVGEEPVARFLPVDLEAINWIVSVMSAPAVQTQGPSTPSAAAAAAAMAKFCLRRHYSCREFSDARELSNGSQDAWYLDAVAGHGYLEKCDKMIITRGKTRSKATMTIERKGVTKYSSDLTADMSSGAKEFEWLEGKDKSNPKITFYIYAYKARVLNGVPGTVRGIRIEVFDEDKGQSKFPPSEPNVICRTCKCDDEPSIAYPCRTDRALIASSTVLDQDDEGNGYEGRR
jgi:hypothetical protein